MDDIDEPRETKRPSKLKRPPRPKTAASRAAAAANSQRYRKRRRDAALPTGPEIDAAFTNFVMLFLTTQEKFGVRLSNLPGLIVQVAELKGWAATDEALIAAINRRLEMQGQRRP